MYVQREFKSSGQIGSHHGAHASEVPNSAESIPGFLFPKADSYSLAVKPTASFSDHLCRADSYESFVQLLAL